MKVLVACEESQEVCKAFREKGHETYSCDIQYCSGGHPEWHIKGDVLGLIDGGTFITCDFKPHVVKQWDMIIAFPPCTDLCVSGARHFEKKRANGSQKDSVDFFYKFVNANCEKIAIENPIGIISGDYVKKWFNIKPLKPTQIIQPYEFGDPHRKSTCLWLKNLAPLKPTKIVKPNLISYTCKNGKKVVFDEYMVKGFNGNRAKHRSKTFPGIAKAMADQWG